MVILFYQTGFIIILAVKSKTALIEEGSTLFADLYFALSWVECTG